MPAIPESSHQETASRRERSGGLLRQGWLALVLLAGLAGSGFLPSPAVADTPVVVHNGPCNASTALGFGSGVFVVADDEAEAPVTLRLFRSGKGGAAIGEGRIPATAVEPLDRKHPELDLEGSTRIGPLAYWIGSHGAAADGPRPNHRRLFATTLGLRGGPDGKGFALTVEPVGRPYTTLIEDLDADPRYGRFALAAAAAKPAKAKGGLNIEGLAATPGGALLIGFRNPLPDGKALLATLANPNAVLAGEKALFGDPVLLDLGGLGIRSMERVNGNLLIAAGPAEGSRGKTPSALYRWSGRFDAAPERLRSFEKVAGERFNAEALFADGDSLVVLSDDGRMESDGKACEDLPRARQTFRELRIKPLP